MQGAPRLQHADAVQHSARPVTMTMRSADHADLQNAYLDLQGVTLLPQEPLGSYPEGSRLLKGHDRSYIIAPLGHLVEESYTPYLQFNLPSH